MTTSITGGAGARPAADLTDVDLRGADLSGRTFTGAGLAGADLRGADLRGARFERCDLRLADLRGARLDEASFALVDAACALLGDVRAPGVSMWHVELPEADLAGADLTGARLHRCGLERADLTSADLAGAHLVHSDCSDAVLRDAHLARTTTLGTRFVGVDLAGARAFATCREVVAEVLSRETRDDTDLAMACAAVVADRRRCYAEWAAYLDDHPAAADLARRTFDRYPRSGCREALRDARRS